VVIMPSTPPLLRLGEDQNLQRTRKIFIIILGVLVVSFVLLFLCIIHIFSNMKIK
jgi:hypothetical protein